jgi:RNA polymerase sigma factor (sigma-70 family)
MMDEIMNGWIEYVENGSEPAFRKVVERYLQMVYSTAFRLVDGHSQLAEDVSQQVFIDLAKLAGTLGPSAMLGAWLHRHTCYLSAKAIRGERRRQNRERISAEMKVENQHTEAELGPLRTILDESINRLSSGDRIAILLRYYEENDFRSIGTALGTNENSARMRVARAVDKLRLLLSRKGVTLTVTSLAALLSTHSLIAAPTSLASALSSTALSAATASSGSSALSFFKWIMMPKLKTGLATSLGAVLLVSPVALQFQNHLRLKNDLVNLRQQLENAVDPSAENFRLAGVESSAHRMTLLRAHQESELASLRAEWSPLVQRVAAIENRLGSVLNNRSRNEPQRDPAHDGGIVYAKSDWTFAGFDTPENTFLSSMWAISQGDLHTFLAALTPEGRQKISGSSEGESKILLEKMIASKSEGLKSVPALRIKRTDITENEVLLDISDEGAPTKGSQMFVRRIEGEWKLALEANK